MTPEEFRARIRELLVAHLLKDAVDDITEVIINSTQPEDYLKTLVDIEDSFDWARTP